MKKVQIILIVIVSTIFLTTCRKDFPRQMAVSINGEIHTSNAVAFTINVADLGENSSVTYGVCYSTTNVLPNINYDSKVMKATNSSGIFALDVAGLTPFKTYYFRAFVNSGLIIYTEPMTIITLPATPVYTGTMTDIDGNVYNTITIGAQEWMAENLKTTKYRNGDAIPYVTNNVTWAALTTGAYCNYDNDAYNGEIYGRLYNWYAVSDSRNIAPTGWHIPTDDEWTILTTYLGGETGSGGELKETGTTHWLSPNIGATNETGFTALPGGFRHTNGEFSNIGKNGYWWSSTECSTSSAFGRDMNYNNSNVYRGSIYNYKYDGYSVRCVKD
jgi:uncharacterized protein (TIGR02145 family)